MVESLASAHQQKSDKNSKIGVDVESIEAIPIENETFVERNFTKQERQYCEKAPDKRASYAGRWAAKEAVFKSLGVASKGAGASLKDIEIESSGETGAPVVKVSFPVLGWVGGRERVGGCVVGGRHSGLVMGERRC